MKLIVGSIFAIIANTYELIDRQIKITERPFYISTQIKDKSEIYNAVDEYNRYPFSPALLETDNKEQNHIRIQYSDDGIMGSTYMDAVINSAGYFELDKTVISFDKRLNGNVLQCVLLHEILHSQMLYHNEIPNSMMNYSVSVIETGEIIEEQKKCELSIDDIIGLMSVKYS